MFLYSRKVSFIDYYINGIKSGNMGIVRQRVTDDSLYLSVELSGLEKWRNGGLEISVGNIHGRKKLLEMEIKEGSGKSQFVLPLKELGSTEGCKLIFELEDNCYGIADVVETSGVLSDVLTNCEEPEEELLEECLEPQPDKWEVIKKKYPILYPFKGQGPYVSIKPVDLQLLNNKYHHLSNNSYLMHGFYQYRHMILGEYSQAQETAFYVGVPGEFVKKEQNSAAMFGFEGYEHSGDLGYYLYRVEL